MVVHELRRRAHLYKMSHQLWRGALVRQRRVDGGFCGLRAYVAGGGATGAPVVVVVVMNY
jgi:hypothetical protein